MSLLKIFQKQALEEVKNQVTAYGFTLAWPFIMAGATLAAGYVQGGPPLAFLITAACLTFMAVSIGIFVLTVLVYQLRPINKLKVSSPMIGRRYEEDRQGENKLKAIKYGIPIENISMYPLDYKITPTKVSLGSSINPNPLRPITGGTVQIGQTGVFWEAEIPLTSQMRNKLVEGDFEFRLQYGKNGRLNCEEIKRYRTHIRFGRTGDILSAEVGDAPPP